MKFNIKLVEDQLSKKKKMTDYCTENSEKS